MSEGVILQFEMVSKSSKTQYFETKAQALRSYFIKATNNH